jgi:hypothetical protein
MQVLVSSDPILDIRINLLIQIVLRHNGPGRRSTRNHREHSTRKDSFHCTSPELLALHGNKFVWLLPSRAEPD